MTKQQLVEKFAHKIIEPVSGLQLYAEIVNVYNYGASGIVLNYSPIYVNVFQKDLVPQSLLGMGLFVTSSYKGGIILERMGQVIWFKEKYVKLDLLIHYDGDVGVRQCFTSLLLKKVCGTLQMCEVIENFNVKLLEKKTMRGMKINSKEII